MRILILSWYFPPANDVAALRVGKLAEYLQASGHDVFVLTGSREHPDQSLPQPLPSARVQRTAWFDVQRLRFHSANRERRDTVRVSAPARGADIGTSSKRRSITQSLNNAYMNVMQVPDRQVGWLPFLLRAGRSVLGQQRADFIYASGPPFSAFLAARSLSRQFSIPWIAEYRDGWSRYVYNPKPRWRQAVDERIENYVSPTASGIVTVSEPWADYYRARFRLPTAAIYNGFDPENLLPPSPRVQSPSDPIVISYMGALYQGLRDPSVLYDALKRSALTPKDVRIFYYGPRPADVYPLAAKFGVSEFVVLHQPVPYQKSLEIQRESDVLLLLQSPADPRNVPAKVFEYLASCRPILGLGLDDGTPAKLIRERNAGFYVSEADAVAAQLKRWVAEKRKTGVLPNLPPSTYAGLSRIEQLHRLDDFLSSLEKRSSPPALVNSTTTRDPP